MRTLQNLFLTAATMLCCTAATWAQTTFENEAGTLKFTVTDAENHFVSVAKGTNEPSGAIDIPSEATDPESGTLYNVTSIDARAFYRCGSLSSVTIPESVTSIGYAAFSYCSSLASVNIPESVTSIDNSTFSYCSSLTSINISNSVTSIGQGAFYGSGLTLITIPNSVTSIGNEAFSYSRNFEEIVFDGETPPRFGTYVFDYTNECPIYVPETALTAYKDATNMSNYADRVSANPLKEVDGIMYKMQEDGTLEVVANNYSGEVVIPSSVNFDGNAAAVTTINSSAFDGCVGLTSVTIPESVTSMSNYSFADCNNLTKVVINSNAVASKEYTENFNLKSIFGSQVTEYVFGENVRTIGVKALCDCDNLTSVSFSGSSQLETISNRAFRGCTSLTSINMPESVTSIGQNAFEGCTGLTSVTIPMSVTSFDQKAFVGCNNITKVTINSNVVASKAYEGNSNLRAVFGSQVTEFVFGEDVTAIGDYAFYNCSNLTSINIPNGVTTIGYSAFTNCTGLSSITIPESVTSIGGYAFYGCSGLSTVTIPNSVTSIGDFAFSSCNGLETVNFNATNCTSMTFCFSNCTSLASLNIGNNVETIPVKAFSNCNSNISETITIPGSVTMIGEYAFDGFSKVKFFIFENETPPTFGSHVFSGSTCPILVPSAEAAAKYRNKIASYDERSRIAAGTAIAEIDGIKYVLNDSDHTSIVWKNNYSGDILIPASIQYSDVSYNVKSIAESAFYGCADLTSVIIPEGVTSIDNYAFRECSSLTSITIPEGVTTIGIWAFQGCSNLKTIIISENVTKIGNVAFADCNNTEEIVFEGQTPPEFGTTVFDNTNDCPIYVPTAAALAAYKQADNMDNYADRVQVKPIVVDGVKYKLQEDGTCTVVANNYSGEIVIRSSVDYNGDETAVTSIAGSAFKDCIDITSVTIPASITSIGYDAFDGCTGLTSITTNCDVIGDANLSFTKDGIRYKVLNKESVEIASYSCLSELVILNAVTAGSTFNIIKIANSAIANCTDLTKVTINNNSIASKTYESNSNLGSIFGSQVTEYVFGENITAIGDYAFFGCSNLASVTISENVTTIGSYAFCNCSGLTSLTIPENITTIGNSAFYGCTNAQEFVFEKATAPAFGSNVFFNTSCPIYVPTAAAITAYRQADNMSNFASRVQVKPIVVDGVMYKLQEDGTCAVLANNYSGEVVIRGSVDYNGDESTVTSISNSAFKDCSDLSSVTIPEGVNTIGSNAFNGCTGLTSVNIPNSVTSIGSSAFFGCTGLTEITIPENVTSIESAAFKNCSGLETLNFNAKNCGAMSGQNYYATFNGCTSLATITIGENVETIPSYAFLCCSSVKTVTIPASVTSIGDDAFKECNEIETLTFDTDAIGYKFNYKPSLKTVNIGSSVRNISIYAFKDCTGLTEINIPEGVTSIGSYAFNGCSSVKSVTIPASVTSIDSYAFDGCSNVETLTYNCDCGGFYKVCTSSLKTVNIGNAVTRIPANAFSGCTGLTSIVIPNSVTSIGADAFYGCKNLKSITLPFIGDKRHSEDDKWQWPLGYIFCDENNYYEGFDGGRKLFQQFICDNPPSVNGRNFYIPRSLEDVTITDCDHIQRGAFYNCANLKSVTISSDVTSVDAQAFQGCSNMEKIVFECETPPTFGVQAFRESNNCPIYVPTEEAVAAYRAAENMGDYYSRIMVNPYCKINVAANNDDYGTVSGGGTYNITTTPTVTITATAAEHYRFVCWEEDGVTDNPRTVAVQPNATFTAVFAEHLLDSLAIENIVAPTCTVAGSYDSVVYCSVCRVELSRDVIDVPAAGHKADSVVFENVVAATRTAAGSYDSVVYCSVCRVELSRTTVNVPQILAESIKLASKPNKVEYKQGEALDVKGGKITIGYTDKSSEDFEILAGWVSGFDSQKVGEQKLTVTFESVSSTLTTTFNVTVSKEDDNTAIDEDAANAVNIYAYQNVIVVENAADEIDIYNAMGALVCRDAARHVSTATGLGARTEIRMNTAGIYIVKVGNVAKRVMIND
ncbi:MAG: leucine-rich repeat protein [Salinivirgaceae bacterium]|nr:leucine-rich repeat protein [Salinivirgaceae bacterium]